MQELQAIREAPVPTFAEAVELAQFLAEHERSSDAMHDGDHISGLQWRPGLVCIVIAGSREFVDWQSQVQIEGFGDAVTAWHRTMDGVSACVVLGWSLTTDGVRTLDRELKRSIAEGRAAR